MTFDQAMSADVRTLNARATITCIDAFVISNMPIMSFSIDEGGQMPLGSVTSASYTMDMPCADGEYLYGGSILGNHSLTGAHVQIQIGVYHDAAWDWVNCGAFTVEKTSFKEYSGRMKLSGNDPMLALDILFDDTLHYTSSTTLNDILTHIKSKGITITGSLACNGNAIIPFAPDWGEEPSIRSALANVLQIGGSFARCDSTGGIVILPAVSATTHSFTTSEYINFTDDERTFTFNRIKMLPNGAKKDAGYVDSHVTDAAESAANTIVLEGNPLFKTATTKSYVSLSEAEEAAGLKNRKYYTKVGSKYVLVEEPAEESMSGYYKQLTNRNTTVLQGIADNLKTALTGLTIKAVSFRWRGNPNIKAGDNLSLTDSNDTTVTSAIIQQTLRYENGFSSEISCPLNLESVVPATITSGGQWTPPYFGAGTIDGSVIMTGTLAGDQISAGSIKADNIAVETITADEIAANAITAVKITAGTITSEKLYAGEIEANRIQAENIAAGEITATHIGTNEIIASAANIKDAAITSAKIGNLEVKTANIDALAVTTAKINDLAVTSGKIGSLEVKEANIDSLAVTNAKIADATIETGKIKDLQVTAAKIADATITNAKIANATIETAKIKDAAITTAKIQDAQITNAKIASAGIDYANIKDVAAGTAIFTQGVGQVLYLGRLIVTDANFASAIIGKLMIRDTDGKLYRISVASDGEVTATQVQVNGDSLTDNAVISVSQRLLYRQATAPDSPFVNMLWYDTTADVLKRCTDDDPLTWEIVPSGGVHTSVIDVDDTGMTVATSGILNLLSGSSLTIKALGDAANILSMDDTGMTLSSTGKIKLSSASSIEIGGSPFQVGGTNLLTGTDYETTYTAWAPNTVNTTQALDSSTAVFGTKSLLISRPASDSYGGVYRHTSLLANTTYTFSVWAYVYAGSWYINSTGHANKLMSGGWQRYSYTITTTTAGNYAISILAVDSAEPAHIFIERPKLEKGNIATDWSPSPQDTVDALAALDGDITDLANNKTTVFYGGTPTATATGDIWYDTGSTPTIIKRWSGSAWVDITDNALAKALSQINTLSSDMVQVFTGNTLPTAANVKMGDMWYFSGTNRTGKVDGRTYRASINGASADSQWTQFDAGAVYTPYISLAADQLVLNGQSSLIMQSATTGNAIVMDGTGMTIQANHGLTLAAADDIKIGSTAYGDVLASSIDLSANNSIKLAVSGGTNLVTLGDFESDWTGGWSRNAGTETWGNGKAYTEYKGNNLRVECAASTAYEGVYKPISGLVIGQVYTLSMWLYTNGNWWVYSGFGVPTQALITSSWRQIVVTFTATASSGNLFVVCQSNATAPSVYIDNVKLEKGTMATDWSPAPEDTTDALADIITDIGGKNTIFYQTSQPTANVTGDLWYDTDSNPVAIYRWSGSAWVNITTTALSAALNAAGDAQATADGKIVSFAQATAPTATAAGDIWFDTDADNKPYRWSGSAWVAYQDTHLDSIVSALSTGKTTIWYQTSQPTATATGDIWYDTDANPVTIKRWSGSTWVDITTTALSQALSAAGTAQATADGKIITFAQDGIPTATAAGDLWVDTNDNNKLYRAVAAGANEIVAGEWVLYKVASGYVATTAITIDNDSIDIVSAGVINMETGTNLNIKSGADIEIESGGDINIASGGNVTVASGGYLNLSAASGIKIGTAPFGVSGTNLLLNSRNMAQSANNAGTGTTVAQSDENEPYQRTTPDADKSVSTYSLDNAINAACFVVPMVVGKVYTLSAEVRPQSAMDVAFFSYKGRQAVASGVWTRISYTYTYSNHVRVVGLTGYTNGAYIDSKNWKIEASPIATEWSPAPADPASGVVTSHVTIEDDSIEIASGGSLTVTAPTTLAITAGATDATAIAIRNDTDYFLSAGDLTQADAPFWVKKDGSIKASKIQQEYSQSFMDLADATYPAEFPVYIPSGYTVDTVTFSFLTKKYRAYSKAAASSVLETGTGGPVEYDPYTGGMADAANTGEASGSTAGNGSHSHTVVGSGTDTVLNHTHGMNSHTHAITDHIHSLDFEHEHLVQEHNHTISLTYGIYEKSTLATSCALKIGATTIGTYSPNPASPVEIKTYLSAGWNTVVVQPNNDARIAGYLLVKLTPS